MRRLLHQALSILAPLCFNILNVLLAGNLPPFGGVCVIVEDQGRFLLVKSSNGKLAFPGGFMRWREHPLQTARRECKEETGLDIDPYEAISMYTSASANFFHMSTINIAYAGKLISGGRLRGSVEGQPEWMSEAEMYKVMGVAYPKLLEEYYAFRKREEAQQSLKGQA